MVSRDLGVLMVWEGELDFFWNGEMDIIIQEKMGERKWEREHAFAYLQVPHVMMLASGPHLSSFGKKLGPENLLE